MRRGTVRSGFAQHMFSLAPQVTVRRSKFNRSFGVKTTFDEGLLIPLLVDEMLPGDTFHCIMNAFARLSTPLYPIMDNMYLESWFFAVPNRLVWDNWERFNGAQDDPGDSTDYLIPQVVMPAVTGAAELSLADYFGIPTKIASLSVNALPFRCYNKIYNDWFRDENLQDSLIVSRADGPDTYSNYNLVRRGKRHDYFTSCLPFPQKGPDVNLPLGVSAPVIGIGKGNTIYGTNTPVYQSDGTIPTYASGQQISDANAQSAFFVEAQNIGGDLYPNIRADLSEATAASINDLRLAIQTQKLFERDARGGTRYTEILKSHFQVTSPDFRLQRSEYLGGGITPVIVNPVAQTSATSGTNALGDLAAYGVCAPQGHGFTYSATEHCYIIGLICVRADINYQQGLDRLWSRSSRFDFYWPAFAHLGEQAVLNKEIYAQGTSADDEVFGYQERYAEYRYKPNLITGLFRSNATASLDPWHLAQDFATLPVLNDEFIVEDAPMSRIEAVSSEPDFKLDCEFTYNCVRPMPVYSVPGWMDHF